MRIMGEMLIQEPVTGSFATFAHKYISPLAGFLTAWSYWFLWVTVGMAEVTAIGIYVGYWFPDIPQWLPALAGVLIIAADQSGGGQVLRRIRVLVCDDQGNRHCGDDCYRNRSYFLRMG